MRRVNAIVLVVTLLLAGGLLATSLPRMRESADRQQCVNNLRMLSIALEGIHDSYGSFPAGTIPNDKLPPERRLSWLVGNWAYLGDGQVHLLIDRTQAWDDDENREPRIDCSRGDTDEHKKELVGEWLAFRCPSNPSRTAPGSPGLTHYVGVAGVGPDPAALPEHYPGVGVFGYDRRTPKSAITDGLSTTMLVIETTARNGPWTAGGTPTVRALDPAGGPYLGVGGQFGSNHLFGLLRLTPPSATNVLFADGSVRVLTASIKPEVFEALATLRGGEEVGRVGEE
jgi:prepilin-type processing-associated H-X9-DG protein